MNPLSLVLTEGVRGSHRVASMMAKGEAFGQLSQILALKFHYADRLPSVYICTKLKILLTPIGIRVAN